MKSWRFRDFAILLLVFGLPAVIAGCGKKDEQAVLRVGTNAEYPPFEYKQGDAFKGIDMDLARMLAQKLNRRLEIVDVQFDALIPSLIAKKFDMAMAAITITPERKQQIDFSVPYYLANQAIIAKNDGAPAIAAPDDLSAFRVGCQNGTTGQIYMDDNLVSKNKMKAENLRKYPTNIEAIADLLNGNVDCVIIDEPVARGYERLKPVQLLFTIQTAEQYGIGFPKGSALKQQVDAVLQPFLPSEAFTDLIKQNIES